MYITHFFYENSQSGANSYVCTFETLEDARNELYSCIYASISGMEQKTMDAIVARFQVSYGEALESFTINGFKVKFTDGGYEIRDKYDEDRYSFQIFTGEVGIRSQF